MALGYVCRGCNGPPRHRRWTGPCPNCGQLFGILTKSVSKKDVPGALSAMPSDGEVVSLRDVETTDVPRTSTLIDGVDMVLGENKADGSHGFADGQIIMVAGDPGSGKSTLLLQIAQGVAKQRHDVLYITGEEMLEQIKERGDRLGKFSTKCRVSRATDIDEVLDLFDEMRPKLFIYDSIQKIEIEEFATGSGPCVSTAAEEITKLSKKFKIATVFVCQISKDGSFAGPKALEHHVDTSLLLKKFGDNRPRVLVATKNRYGTADLSAKFLMTPYGLKDITREEAEEEAKQKREREEADKETSKTATT